jgi:hypothetical protein
MEKEKTSDSQKTYLQILVEKKKNNTSNNSNSE